MALSSASELTLDALTVAVFVSVPGLVAVTTIVIIALLPPSKASNAAGDRPVLWSRGAARGAAASSLRRGHRDKHAAGEQRIADRHVRRGLPTGIGGGDRVGELLAANHRVRQPDLVIDRSAGSG